MSQPYKSNFITILYKGMLYPYKAMSQPYKETL